MPVQQHFSFKNWNDTALEFTLSIDGITVEGDLEIGDVYENLTVFIVEHGDPAEDYVLKLDVLNPAARIGHIELEAGDLIAYDLIIAYNVSAVWPYQGKVEWFSDDTFTIQADFNIELAT